MSAKAPKKGSSKVSAQPPVPLIETPAVPGERDPNKPHLDLPASGFEGPLDLLLHLVQTHELDILDIPVSFITKKFLEFLNVMSAMSIDVSSEFLVMAAYLTHLKSKMLLPDAPKDNTDDPEEEMLDPREELVRRLLEYQKYKHAAAELGSFGVLGEDVFTRPEGPKPTFDGPAPLAPVPAFQLFDAFQKLLEKKQMKVSHEVTFDRLSITDRIHEIVDILKLKKQVSFDALFDGVVTRFDLVITFLALLEMTKLRMTRLFQSEVLAPLHVELAITDDQEMPEIDATSDTGAP